jgi:hypothetical protein
MDNGDDAYCRWRLYGPLALEHPCGLAYFHGGHETTARGYVVIRTEP